MMEMDAPSDQSLSGKEIKVESQTVSIPVDLVIDILQRLSARDVLRCRSVCKEWNFLLRTPRFISLHYNRSLQKRHENAADSSSFICLRNVPSRPSFRTSPPEPCPGEDPVSIALTFLTLEKTTTNLVAIVDKEEDLLATLSSILFPYCPTESDMETLQMICPFDGLICFGCGERVIMYNPASRESKVLPVEPEFSNVTHSCFDIMGVWFESTVKQTYKVFRMDRSGNNSAKIHIYDSTVDSWRVSKTVDGTAVYRSGLLLNGVVYFCTMRDSVPVIGTFDAKLETFGYLEVPQTFANGWHVSFLPFQGNLAYMNKYIDINDYDTVKFDLWVMKEDGVQQSWTRKFCVPFDYSNYDMFADEYYYGSPIAFWKNKDEEDELLIKSNGETMSFNLNTMKKINLKLPYRKFLEMTIIPYNVESLLSLK